MEQRVGFVLFVFFWIHQLFSASKWLVPGKVGSRRRVMFVVVIGGVTERGRVGLHYVVLLCGVVLRWR